MLALLSLLAAPLAHADATPCRTIDARLIGAGDAKATTHDNGPDAIALSPDERLVASGDKEGVVIAWNIASGRALRSWRARGGTVSALAFSPDGRWLVAGYGDETVRIWSVEGTTPRAVLRKAGRLVAMARGGTFVAVDGEGVAVRRLPEGTVVTRTKLDGARDATALAVAPSGAQIAVATPQQGEKGMVGSVSLCSSGSCRPIATAPTPLAALLFRDETALIGASPHESWQWSLPAGSLSRQWAAAVIGLAGASAVTLADGDAQVERSGGQAPLCLVAGKDRSPGATAASLHWVARTDLEGFGVLLWSLPSN
jgi:WD40 repeat protein